MQRWGRTRDRKQRWRCPVCEKSGVRKRKDNREKKRLSLFLEWITTKKSLTQIAKEASRQRMTVYRWFDAFFLYPPMPCIPKTPVRILVLDGTSAKPRICMLLFAGDADTHKPVTWLTVSRESYSSWKYFLEPLRTSGVDPKYIVCDGQRGLLKAILEVWPHAHIQRCLIHVVRQASIWLTRHPKTKTGRELLIIVRQLVHIRSKRQKRRWIRVFNYWKRRHYRFLAERTTMLSGHWWYTHRKLRAVRSLLTHAIPDLFRFVTDPSVPRTSNHVEGGLNARIKELFRSHRGISLQKKIALAGWYLSQRQKR